MAALALATTLLATMAANAQLTTEAPTLTISTVIASPSGSLDAPLPSQVPLPPEQEWCPSEIFCPGELLQTVNLADLFVDQKTFVDKPTNGTSEEVLAAFAEINSSNATNEEVLRFVETYFGGEGTELQAVELENFNENPTFLDGVSDPLVRGFSQAVHGFWTQLIRTTNESTLCDGDECESSLLPLNHTFVVPGGRFREQYYWDTFWIVEGLLESELYDIANSSLQNFMDELDTIGFIPNGMRIYFLNRSQPPLFIPMLSRYVKTSNDTDILERALPLAERELRWWQENRMLNVTSPWTNQTHLLARYNVNNSAPRPESYLTDYETANGPEVNPPLNESQRSDLYAELATGAESGWDYTARWNDDGSPDLTTLNIRNTIPVDLNSILYMNHILLSELYTIADTSPESGVDHEEVAARLREGILDLFWNETKLAFYDYNLKTESQNDIFTAATFYPLWGGIVPDALTNSSDNAFAFFSSVNLVMNRYNGTYPTTFLETGLQWDAPNAWPPHQYITLQALRALPSNVTNTSLPQPSSGESTFSLVPSGQLGLEESSLPHQPVSAGQNASSSGSAADINMLESGATVFNGGNATDGEGWATALQRELANRYFTSVFCSWYATGGSIPDLLPQLSEEELNVTQSVGQEGHMFEKFSNTDIDSAGRGGEYQVQAGFGWTNGVLLWVTSTYGDVLVAPQCPDLLTSAATEGGGGDSGSDSGSDSGDGDSDDSDSQEDAASSQWRTGGLEIGKLVAAAIVAQILSKLLI